MIIPTLRTIVRFLLAALFVAAGIIHLSHPEPFLQIMPPAIPFHRACVLVSGICELLGGVGLLVNQRRIQFATGWFLTLLLIAIFPANIYMAVNHVQVAGLHIPSWAEWARLPFQPLLIAAVLWSTGAWSGLCGKEAHATKDNWKTNR